MKWIESQRPMFLKMTAVSLIMLLSFSCSSADPTSQPNELSTVLPTVVVEERYELQQQLGFTINLTTTSITGSFGRLHKRHTCEQSDMSPQLSWEGVPSEAKSLALIMEDPISDVYGFFQDVLWTHWVVYSIPPDVNQLEPAQVSGDLLVNGSKQGLNDNKQIQYNGPCPIPMLTFPPLQYKTDAEATKPTIHFKAEERPYYFRVYALDVALDLPSGADRDILMQAIDGHILAAGELAIPYKSTKKIPCKTQSQQACLDKARLVRIS